MILWCFEQGDAGITTRLFVYIFNGPVVSEMFENDDCRHTPDRWIPGRHWSHWCIISSPMSLWQLSLQQKGSKWPWVAHLNLLGNLLCPWNSDVLAVGP